MAFLNSNGYEISRRIEKMQELAYLYLLRGCNRDMRLSQANLTYTTFLTFFAFYHLFGHNWPYLTQIGMYFQEQLRNAIPQVTNTRLEEDPEVAAPRAASHHIGNTKNDTVVKLGFAWKVVWTFMINVFTMLYSFQEDQASRRFRAA